jgi:hypothetical protein
MSFPNLRAQDRPGRQYAVTPDAIWPNPSLAGPCAFPHVAWYAGGAVLAQEPRLAYVLPAPVCLSEGRLP